MVLFYVAFSFGLFMCALKYNPAEAGAPAQAKGVNIDQNNVTIVAVGRRIYKVEWNDSSYDAGRIQTILSQ
jgi:hypothetical protein